MILASLGLAQPTLPGLEALGLHRLESPPFTLYYPPAAVSYLPSILDTAHAAAHDLHSWGLQLPNQVTIIVHRDLASYQHLSGMPMHVLASSDRTSATIHSQRIGVLLRRGSVHSSLRHELFHLAQPAHLRRWHTEAFAMRFAGEVREGTGAPQLSEQALDAGLAQPHTSHYIQLMTESYRRGQQLDWQHLREPTKP